MLYIYIYKKKKKKKQTHTRHIQNDVFCIAWALCIYGWLASSICSVIWCRCCYPYSNCISTYSLCRKVRNLKYISATGIPTLQSASDRKEKHFTTLGELRKSENSNSNVQCGFYNTQIYAEYRSALRPCLGAAGVLCVLGLLRVCYSLLTKVLYVHIAHQQ